MKSLRLMSAVLVILFCFGPDEAGAIISEVGDRAGLELTVYSGGLGLVREERVIEMAGGTQELRWAGAAAKALAPSVRVRPLSGGGGLSVLEQALRYDRLTPKTLMDAHVARRVTLLYRDPATGEEERTEATLLSNEGEPVFEIGGEVTFGVEGRIVFPSVPGGLFLRPTFVWLVENARPGPRRLEALYLTEGMGWSADYSLVLDEETGSADLDCLATVENQSGADFMDVSLTLVAGSVQRAGKEPGRFPAAAEALRAAGFREEALFEYHAYALQRAVDLPDGESRQLGLLSAGAVPVTKEYVFESRPVYYAPRPAPEETRGVGVYIEAENTVAGGLGSPLPGGTVRMYRRGPEGGLAFVGEDAVSHTPEGAGIRLRAGEAFDLTGRRVRISWTDLGRDAYESSFEITLSNAKDEDALVKVVEEIPGDWEIVRSTVDFEKAGANRAVFEVRVPAGGEATLAYTVRVRQ